MPVGMDTSERPLLVQRDGAVETPDQREGIQALLEKRRPRFNRESEWGPGEAS